MKLTAQQKAQLAFHDLKDSLFPDPRPSIAFIVQEVTGNGNFRVIDKEEKRAIIQSLEANGYEKEDAEIGLAAFERAATLDWLKHDPR